mgnify:CR=1 FL=1
MARRIRYSPEEVVINIVSRDMYFRIASIVFSSDRPLHAGEISYMLRKDGVLVSREYAYALLRRMEKWGVVEAVKDPINGKSMFRPSGRKVAKLLKQEIEKRRMKEMEAMLVGDGDVSQ